MNEEINWVSRSCMLRVWKVSNSAIFLNFTLCTRKENYHFGSSSFFNEKIEKSLMNTFIVNINQLISISWFHSLFFFKNCILVKSSILQKFCFTDIIDFSKQSFTENYIVKETTWSVQKNSFTYEISNRQLLSFLNSFFWETTFTVSKNFNLVTKPCYLLLWPYFSLRTILRRYNNRNVTT